MIRGMAVILTPPEAARFLGVSPATLANWRRADLISSLKEDDLSHFKETRAYKNRLTKRANKGSASRNQAPRGYGFPPPGGEAQVERVLTRLIPYSPEEILFFGLADLVDRQGTPGRTGEEMAAWRSDLFGDRPLPVRPFFPLSLTEWEDFPGWLYQRVQREGRRSRCGSYYTPSPVVKAAFKSLSFKGNDRLLDPCCGTGSFLLEGARLLGDPRRVSGQDIDPLAVRLARLNLMLHFPREDFVPDIRRGDSLLNYGGKDEKKDFSFIATNPPWGYRFARETREKLASHYPPSVSESASLFVLNALKRLSPGGEAAMLLPESLFNRAIHKEFRDRIIGDTREISWLGPVFKGVQSHCVLLVLKKDDKSPTLTIGGSPDSFTCAKSDVISTPLGVWNIHSTREERKIWEKLFRRPHGRLPRETRWGMGIVTGNNGKHLKKTPRPDRYPLLAGRDLAPFSHKEPRLYLNYHDPRLQQKAPLEDYLAPKLIYRFISERPCFARDGAGTVLLNSANYLITPPDYPWEIPLLLFNSSLFGAYFKKVFHTVKVLRSQLETLPLPDLTSGEKASLTNLLPLLERDYPRHRPELDRLVYGLYDLTPEECETIEKIL